MLGHTYNNLMDEGIPMNKNIKILLVNNNATSDNQVIAQALSELKLSNIVAVNSTKAALKEYVKEAAEHPFEVVMISDLPDHDEIELMRSLLEINPSAYIVMLTCDVSADKVLSSIRNGASGLLNQPFSAGKFRLELEKYSLLREDKAAQYS